MKVNALMLIRALENLPPPRHKFDYRPVAVQDRLDTLNYADKLMPANATVQLIYVRASVFCTGGHTWYEWEIDVNV